MYFLQRVTTILGRLGLDWPHHRGRLDDRHRGEAGRHRDVLRYRLIPQGDVRSRDRIAGPVGDANSPVAGVGPLDPRVRDDEPARDRFVELDKALVGIVPEPTE